MGKSYLARQLAIDRAGRGSLVLYYTPNGAGRDPFPGPDMTVADLRACKDVPRAVCLRGEDPDDVCLAAMDAAEKWHVVLVMDEAQEVFLPNFSPRTPSGILFHRGRHLGVDLFVVTQWPSRIDMRPFRAATNVYWFRLLSHADLRWVEREYGETAARQVASLPPWEHVAVIEDELPAGWARYGGEDAQPIVST